MGGLDGKEWFLLSTLLLPDCGALATWHYR